VIEANRRIHIGRDERKVIDAAPMDFVRAIVGHGSSCLGYLMPTFLV
jgi:hypothetical protein